MPIPSTPCSAAVAHIEGCGYPAIAQFGVDWDRCAERDECAAECALEMSCQGLMCDWDPDIDCDSAPWVDCVMERCDGPPPPECEMDDDCGRTVDCCAQAFLCFDPNNPPEVCDRDCDPPMPHPGCLCLDGRCTTRSEGRTICQQALERFQGECGYDIDTTYPEDRAVLVAMRDGRCNQADQCYSACIVHEQDDQCMQCHFGELDCDRDPFAECVDACGRPSPEATCVETGGRWGDGECERCCGAPFCGSNPFGGCMLGCCGPPQCYCPPDRPFWSLMEGCFERDSCHPNDGSSCRSLRGQCTQGDNACPPDRRPAGHDYGCDGVCCVPA